MRARYYCWPYSRRKRAGRDKCYRLIIRASLLWKYCGLPIGAGLPCVKSKSKKGSKPAMQIVKKSRQIIQVYNLKSFRRKTASKLKDEQHSGCSAQAVR